MESDDVDAVIRAATALPAFMGTHEPRLDEKGRFALPAKFRERLAAGLVITRGQEFCLYVYPAAEFAELYDRMRAAPVTSKTTRDYQRMFMSGAEPQTPDRQGRVLIPTKLRRYARLERDMVVIGVGARVEIWDATSWEAFYAEQEAPFAERSEEVLPGMF